MKILIIAKHLAGYTNFVIIYFSPRVKNILEVIHFYHILHKSFGLLYIEDLRGLYLSSPPPKPFEEKCTIYLLYLYVHFRRVYVEFVVLKLKFILLLQLNVRERAVQWAVFDPPPLPFTPRSDRCN